MNKLTEKIKSLLKPSAALIAYKGEHIINNAYFLELREIDNNGVMGEAIPVTYDFMNDITANYLEGHNSVPAGRIPDNLLFADTRKGQEKFVWSNPSRKRMMFFVAGLGLENAEYNVPGIVYVAKEEVLSVYAYKDKVLSDETELFAGPFFNTSKDSVCTGSAKLQKPSNPTYAELLEYWEKIFWLTEFSHLGREGNPTKHNLVLVTKAAKDKPFDLNELKSIKKTLKSILK